ncbi:type II toxin-antitoxin system PemK/MazF family toxin [Fulvimarina endophytica]|uniref:type II toxin-antitoxin system PemK/MazF family toxin n=1 Tax=Fulvimarina endophytica TaxID=2293836 RepID=UPI001313DF97|nr:type II toxin-antitoxin system PemK/MazF family toxin [Fulvimarina endophytica]
MKRGDVFIASIKGTASKPRPSVVVQANEFILPERPIIVCPLTSILADASMIRVTIRPTPTNGLREISQAMVDRLSAALPERIGTRIGHLEAEDIARIKFALINVLSLQKALPIASGLGIQT